MLLLSASRTRLRPAATFSALETGEHAALDRSERLAELLRKLRLRQSSVVGELDRLSLVGRETAERVLDDLAPRTRDTASSCSRAFGLGQPLRSARRGGAPPGGRGRPRAGARTSAPRCSPSPARGGSRRLRARPGGTPPAPRPRRAPGHEGCAAPGRRRRGRSGRRARRGLLVGVGDGCEQCFVGKVRGVSPHGSADSW